VSSQLRVKWNRIVALVWGLFEATWFFIVPDVWLTVISRKRLRPGVIASLYALAGALVGGAIIYTIRPGDAFLDWVPGISSAMIEEARADMSAHPNRAVFIGPLFGVPYKIFSANASAAGTSLPLFLLVSIPARLLRFLVVTIVCHAILQPLNRWLGERGAFSVLIIGWIAFYVFYFWAVGW
jgi:membrane protein YqaA with SNARE-associated domain